MIALDFFIRRLNHSTRGGWRRSAGGARCIAAFLLAGGMFAVNGAEDPKAVSYMHQVVPILKRSCTGCHHPGKMKADLDLTTHAAVQKGGKHGPIIVPGDPKKSLLIDEVSGKEPSMPKEGDPLAQSEVALIERWISEGAKDDTPPEQTNPFKLAAPPSYTMPPVIPALAFSKDGAVLAVAAYHEIVLHRGDGSALLARLVGESPRIESIAFSPDGRWLAACGGAPSVFGEVQLWELSSHKLAGAYKISIDTLYGVSFSPDSRRVAFGCADKSVRIIGVDGGRELLKFDNHSDWVFGTTFTVDGKRLLSGSRDRAMKLIDAASGQFIDDINKLLEGVVCLARHPTQDQVLYGGDLRTPRIYRISENQGRTAANNDVNLVREFERQPGAIHAVAYSPDGTGVAVGGVGGEVRLYKTSDGSRLATLKGHQGAIFSLVYHPKEPYLATGGYDGTVRLYQLPEGKLLKAFVPVPLREKSEKLAGTEPQTIVVGPE